MSKVADAFASVIGHPKNQHAGKYEISRLSLNAALSKWLVEIFQTWMADKNLGLGLVDKQWAMKVQACQFIEAKAPHSKHQCKKLHQHKNLEKRSLPKLRC